MWGLVPWPGIEPQSLALGVWNPNHWTTREVPDIQFPVQCELTGEGVLC